MLFFFSKQKTAYEMLISDWSSDVCSSDLQAQRHGGISCFLVPLDAPGITMLPLENMADGQQNQTFFDNVRLPADALLGGEGQAWNQIWLDRKSTRLNSSH